MKEQYGGTLTLWTCYATFHYAPVSYVRLLPGDSDDWIFTLHSVCVGVCVHADTYLLPELLNQPQVYSNHLHLTDSRHGLNRMSGEDAAALTSLSFPINTRTSIMSAPVPDLWRALSEAEQCGINPQIIRTVCRGSVLSNLKWTHLLL